MANAREVLRGFDLADPAERLEIIRGLADRISVDEADCLAKARHKCDILGHDQMPPEIRLMIVQYLDISDIYNCTLLVCRKWKYLFQSFKAMAEDVLQKWFPCLYGKDMPVEDMLKLFSQAITKRYLRDTGRFQSRLTFKFAKSNNQTRKRIEGLQRGHTYKDLTCSSTPWIPTSSGSSISTSPPTGSESADEVEHSIQSSETKESTVAKYIYADGRLAWQMRGSDPGSSVIFFHDLHNLKAQQPCVFQIPRQRVQGIKLRLESVGNELIIASVVGQRRLYARNFLTQTDDSVTLPAALDRCITHGQSVLIITVQGDLLLWTFLREVVQIDTSTQPQDQEAYCGPAKYPFDPCPSLTRQDVRQSKFIFHPEDANIFFIATVHVSDSGWTRVSEFRDKLCSRIFTYNFASPIEMITHTSSTWDRLTDYDGIWKPPLSPDLTAKKADAHGTYMLWEVRARIDDTNRLIYVMFNTLSTSFSARSFETPSKCDYLPGEPALVWNGQLCLHDRHLRTSSAQACHSNPLLVLQSLKPATLPREDRLGTQREKDQSEMVTNKKDKLDELELRVVWKEMLTSTMMQQPETFRTPVAPKKDIVRYQDIARAYPYATDFHYRLGLLYMCSFYGGECNSADPHVTGCTRKPLAPPSGGDIAPRTQLSCFPLNHFPHRGDEDWQDIQPEAIFGDDDFLIVVTARGLCTVFALDPDRAMAKALTEIPGGSADIMDTGP